MSLRVSFRIARSVFSGVCTLAPKETVDSWESVGVVEPLSPELLVTGEVGAAVKESIRISGMSPDSAGVSVSVLAT